MDLKNPYNQKDYLNFLADKFNFAKSLTAINIDNTEVKSFKKLGKIITADDKKTTLPVFEIHIKANTQLAKNRVQLRAKYYGII